MTTKKPSPFDGLFMEDILGAIRQGVHDAFSEKLKYLSLGQVMNSINDGVDTAFSRHLIGNLDGFVDNHSGRDVLEDGVKEATAGYLQHYGHLPR